MDYLLQNSVWRGDSEGFHFAVEVAAFESERRGSLGHVPAVFLQLAKNELAFVGVARFVKRRIRMMRAFGNTAKQLRREVVRFNARLRANDDQPLHEIAKFTDITRPGITEQHFHGGIAEFARFLAVRGAELPQKIVRQRG